jgi:dUTPase
MCSVMNKFVRIHDGEIDRPPTRDYDSDVGIGLFCQKEENFYIECRETLLISTGYRYICENNEGHYYGQLFTRSSMAAKGLMVGGGVIDPGYTGEIVVVLTCLGERQLIDVSRPIAQLVLIVSPFTRPLIVDEKIILPSSDQRESKGFGSSDLKRKREALSSSGDSQLP